jgi:hypothetical protein
MISKLVRYAGIMPEVFAASDVPCMSMERMIFTMRRLSD